MPDIFYFLLDDTTSFPTLSLLVWTTLMCFLALWFLVEFGQRGSLIRVGGRITSGCLHHLTKGTLLSKWSYLYDLVLKFLVVYSLLLPSGLSLAAVSLCEDRNQCRQVLQVTFLKTEHVQGTSWIFSEGMFQTMAQRNGTQVVVPQGN